MNQIQELRPEALYRRCEFGPSDFETTEDLEDLAEVIGQPRAVEAVRFGIGIGREGYNIFALGPAGTGKKSLVNLFLRERAAAEPVPPDLCYVYNFEQPYRPRAMRLPPGTAARLARDMESLVEELRITLPATFESEDYQTRRQAVEEEFRERQQQAFETLQQRAQEHGLSVFRTPSGLAFAPMRDGEVLPPEEFQKLPEDERKQMEREVEELHKESQDILQQVPRLEKEMREKVRQLTRDITSLAVEHLMEDPRTRYANLPEIVDYLENVQRDIVQNARDFLGQEDQQQAASGQTPRASEGVSAVRRYQVNVLVDHGESQGAPVVYEDNPTSQNLIGRMEHLAEMGALRTDFTLLKPGVLHRANNGYLVMDVRKVLMQPLAWEELKRALKSHQVRIESPGQTLGVISTVSLQPEPVPLDIKVILLGDAPLYYLLRQADPEFGELFKVAADFSEEMDRTPETQALYARIVATLARREKLRPFDRAAVARIVERCSRTVEDSEKLSLRMRETTDLLREADYWAEETGRPVVGVGEVQRAIDARTHRSDRMRERIQEEILRGTLLIDTDGEAVGQINGLSVLQLGDFAFGQPTRITARVRMGRGEVVDIEREVEMSGPSHSKGVLILSGFLGARYAAEHPLSLSASLVFEQSYGGVDGDSASSTELYVLLSAIAGVPIRQSLAVTGSVNQHGRVQAIGGVNEKIEGFFDVCRARGLTGNQGVLIPVANVKHLMLRRDVVEAVAAGQFHVYPVETVDQGIERLTGLPAGEPDADGNYPEDSVNGRVRKRLAELAEKRAAFRAAADEGETP